MEGKSKISNVEWGLVIGALFLIDLTQIGLEWILIGFLINPFIDILVGMGLAFYLHIRGQSMASPKRLAGLAATFVGEMIPVIAELPLWTLDGIFNMVISKSDKIMSAMGANEAAETGTEGTAPTRQIVRSEPTPQPESRQRRSMIQDINTGTEQIKALNKAIKDNRKEQ